MYKLDSDCLSIFKYTQRLVHQNNKFIYNVPQTILAKKAHQNHIPLKQQCKAKDQDYHLDYLGTPKARTEFFLATHHHYYYQLISHVDNNDFNDVLV